MRNALLSLLALSLLSSSTFAEEWKMLPINEADYDANISVAIIGGENSFEGEGQGTKGLEVSFTSALIKPPKHSIRQQISYTSFKDADVKVMSLEMNPHYMFKLNNTLHVGVGPSLGVTKIESDNGNDDDGVFAYGVGASVRYELNSKMFVGAETRYAWTGDADFNGSKRDVNNRRLMVKVGFNF